MIKNITRIEPIAMILLMWLLYLIALLSPISFLNFGIMPRSLGGLIGLFTAPFVHLGLYHILSNSIPFVILGLLVRMEGRARFIKVTAIIMVIGGLVPWLFSGADSIVGASGLVFGYWAYLLCNGIYTRSLKAIAIAIVVFIVYGTMFFSLFRFYPGVSFAGHLGGALGGFCASYVLTNFLSSKAADNK
ncbi:MAG: rhomboid family intramembrane serine protease [SAR86 cluster bacterium]|uniref:Rhomboid family intramembrane serine protease n=1 Tax=SAR86 cluster bacterium TaxID=2030880 RepID=A0A2A4MPS5_9GAMM|nr:MAG: rhomboid family intramembrane serine protease [SAR86 cluster bacterium]